MIAEPLRPLARPVAGLRVLEGNPRRGDVQAVKRSLKRFGQRKPIVARPDGTVTAGNHTLLAAIELGWAEIAVVGTDDDEATAKAYALADNRTSALGTFDLADLAAMAAEVHAADPALLEAASFTEADLNAMLAGLKVPEKRTDPDAVPDAPAEPVTQPGDLWLLGPHRLLCGDSTDPDAVARLMARDKAGVVCTDPPYGVSLRLEDNHEASNKAKGIDATYRHFAPIVGDDRSGPELQAFLEECIRAALPHLNDNAAWYLWHAQMTQGFFAAAAAAAAADLIIHRQIIWAKPHFIFGRGDYHWQHELCFYGWRKGHRPPWYGERNQSTLWSPGEGGGSIRKDQDHPTQKPVALYGPPIINHLKPGDVIYDPFLGSGTAIIAAHINRVRCYGLELAPAYCDVICRRYQEHTGIKPVLEQSGQPHDFTAA